MFLFPSRSFPGKFQLSPYELILAMHSFLNQSWIPCLGIDSYPNHESSESFWTLYPFFLVVSQQSLNFTLCITAKLLDTLKLHHTFFLWLFFPCSGHVLLGKKTLCTFQVYIQTSPLVKSSLIFTKLLSPSFVILEQTVYLSNVRILITTMKVFLCLVPYDCPGLTISTCVLRPILLYTSRI